MTPETHSVRQWQEQFKAGFYDSPDIHTQCGAGWYDWFCQDRALAGRLKKIAKVVMGVTNPFILDNFYIWFKNNAQVAGPLYDDVRFEPISGERDGKYFLVTLDYTAVRAKWALFSERYGIGDLETLPEFVCDNVRDMIRYVNKLGAELEQGAPGPLVTEKKAVADYIASQPDLKGFTDLHRIDAHTYSVFLARENRKEFIHATPTPAYAPPGFQAGQAVQINGFYVSRHDHRMLVPQDYEPDGRKPDKKRGGSER